MFRASQDFHDYLRSDLREFVRLYDALAESADKNLHLPASDVSGSDGYKGILHFCKSVRPLSLKAESALIHADKFLQNVIEATI